MSKPAGGRFFVTGALGHIGSRLIRWLPTRFPGAEVVMLDDLSCQRYCSLFNLPEAGRYRFVEADVVSADLRPLAEDAVVIHLAAITDATNSFANAERVAHVNFGGTQRVAEACVAVGAPMIHLSSTSVYGSQKALVDEDCPASELVPQSPYADVKLREESLLRTMRAERGLRHIDCRFGTIAGPSHGMRFHTAVNKFCWQAVMGLPLTVWRTALHQKRPYLALDDAVAAIGFIIERDLFDGQTYNVVSDNLTVDGVIACIRQYIPDLQIACVDAPIMNQLSYEVSRRKFIDAGFRFRGSLTESIGATLAMIAQGNGVDITIPRLTADAAARPFAANL
jgi:UDP-glucose 4-epimerase